MAQVKSLKTGIKFKDTPVGKIPVDWEVRKVGDVCVIFGGSTPSTAIKEYWNGDILWATPTDITNLQGRTIEGTKQRISEKGLKSCAANLLPEGSILITSRATIGACAINTKPMATNQGFASLVCNEQVVNWFIYYLMLLFRNELKRLGSGSTFKEVSKKSVRALYIPIPPLPEQKKIAEILMTVDDAIEETDRIIEKTKELKKGLMQRLLTRGIGHKKFKKTEIGEIPVEWKVVRLNEIANVRYGLGQPPELDDKGIAMIRATNIHQGEISETGLISVKRDAIPASRNPFLKEGDIIVVRSGAYTGDIGLITKEWEGAIAGYDLVITPFNKIDSVFLTNYLLSNIIQKDYFASLRERSAQPHLNSLQVEETPIALPPITEQNKIAKVLSSAHLEIKQEEAQKKYLETLKKSLMQVLLTGKIRVKLH